jgi:hypothetical protein
MALVSMLLCVLLFSPAMVEAAALTVTDVNQRAVTVAAPVDRLVVMFNYEEFTAIGGREAWDRVVGYSKTPWAGWRHSVWQREARDRDTRRRTAARDRHRHRQKRCDGRDPCGI